MVGYDSSILSAIREVVVGTKDNKDFDPDLKMQINGALSKLNQVGVGQHIIIDDDETLWSDFMDGTQIEGNRYFHLVPLFVALNTKMLFDPPPPSSVEYHSRQIDELLWRIKFAYEQR